MGDPKMSFTASNDALHENHCVRESISDDLQDNLKDAEERGNWTGKLDFILSCVGYAVGLGNVWRFPYLCFNNGGGAFLFPYIIMLVLCGLPLFFMELAVGQFSSQGPITLYRKLNHYFVGIGWAMVIISFLTGVYYNVIIMWSIFYLFTSFASDVPWRSCDPIWASEWCMELKTIADLPTDMERIQETARRYNESCLERVASGMPDSTFSSIPNIRDVIEKNKYPTSLLNLTFADLELHSLPNTSAAISAISNSSSTFRGLGDILLTVLRDTRTNDNIQYFKDCRKRFELPSGDFFHRYMLEIQHSNGADDIGTIRWQLLVVFVFAWIIIFLCLIKGVRSSGKVVYVTATFPYVVLIALLIRGVTLEGYMEGIKFYIIPEWEKLKDASVWAAAATQIFYSLGPGFGGLLTFASYNNFYNNCHRDAIIVALINCGTSIFAGFAVFSIIGFIAFTTGLDVRDVPVSGEGLLFIAYPEAIARMPLPTLWAILFFLMVFTLGLDSQFAMMETVISAIGDNFHKQLRSKKSILTFGACFICMLCGLPCVTYGGFYVVQLMNWYCASYSLLIVSLFNVIVIMYVYGIRNFFDDIKMMLGVKPSVYYLVTWSFLTPLVISLIVIASGIQHTPASYRRYVFPSSIQGIGWGTMIISVAMIPLMFLFEIFRFKETRQSLKEEMKPAITWGPALAEDRVGRYEVKKSNDEQMHVDNNVRQIYDNPAFTSSTHM